MTTEAAVPSVGPGAVRAASVKDHVAARVCPHQPRCPGASGIDRDAAHVIAAWPEQGWSLLCNGVVLFEDTGEILPDGRCSGARRADLTAAALHRAA
jgi:hypothetical protein